MRILRASLVTSCVTALGVLAHVAGHGSVPPVLSLLPVLAVIFGVTLLLDRGPVSSVTLMALLAAAQSGIHFLAAYLEGPGHSFEPGPMFLAHVVATIVTAFAISHGERLWDQFVTWLGRWQVAGVTGYRLQPMPRIPVLLGSEGPLAAACLHSVGVRGPPVFALR